VPEFGEGTSSTAEVEQATPAARSAEGSIIVPKVPTAGPTEKADAVKEPKLEKLVIISKNLSPPAEAELPKVIKAPATTPKRRRMASVLDAVMETIKALTPAPTKKVAEAVTIQAKAEDGPSVSIETKAAAPEDKTGQQTLDTSMTAVQGMIDKAKSPAPKAPAEDVDYIIRHASGKELSKEEILEA
jgi:ribosomal protein L14